MLASATRFPARSAASVASRPAAPTTALTTMSTSGCVAASSSTSGPQGQRVVRAGRREPRERGAPLRHLPLELLAVPAAGQGHHREVIALAPQHVERAPADRAGRAQHRDAASPATVAHQITPKNRYIAAVTGSTK